MTARRSRPHAKAVAPAAEGQHSTDWAVLAFYGISAKQILLKSLGMSRLYRGNGPHLIAVPAMVTQRPGISQGELARLLGGEPATIGLQIAECMRRGWIQRKVARRDRRCYSLWVTPAGKSMVADVADAVVANEQAFVDRLDARERVLLGRLLAKIVAE